MADKLQIIPSSRLFTSVVAQSSNGTIQLPASEVLVRADSGDRVLRGNLLTVFDSGTGLYLWICEIHPVLRKFEHDSLRAPELRLRLVEDVRSKHLPMYADSNRLVAFCFDGFREVLLRDSAGRAASLEEAERKASQAGNQALGAMQKDYRFGWKPIRPPIPRYDDFLAPKYSAQVGSADFVGVLRVAGGWQFLLRGQWTLKIAVDDQLNVLSLQRID